MGNKEKDITLRLGGIYAFEDVMNTSEENHKPVLEGLSAFVRENILGHQRQDPPPSREGRMVGVTSVLLLFRSRMPQYFPTHLRHVATT